MSTRKKEGRKGRFFDFFGFDEEDFLFEPEPVEGGSGYSISVIYDEKGKPVVQVKTHGYVDTAELRKDIEQRYPGAEIEGLEGKPLIRIVGERERGRQGRKTEKKEGMITKKEKKKSLIRVVE